MVRKLGVLRPFLGLKCTKSQTKPKDPSSYCEGLDWKKNSNYSDAREGETE